jgi:ABC-type transport system involved in cytochrome c biogenesis permease component
MKNLYKTRFISGICNEFQKTCRIQKRQKIEYIIHGIICLLMVWSMTKLPESFTPQLKQNPALSIMLLFVTLLAIECASFCAREMVQECQSGSIEQLFLADQSLFTILVQRYTARFVLITLPQLLLSLTMACVLGILPWEPVLKLLPLIFLSPLAILGWATFLAATMFIDRTFFTGLALYSSLVAWLMHEFTTPGLMPWLFPPLFAHKAGAILLGRAQFSILEILLFVTQCLVHLCIGAWIFRRALNLARSRGGLSYQ